MIKEGKILLTNINADKDREKSVEGYLKILAAAFYEYSTIKLSMNLFTMYEMSEEIALNMREEIEGYIDSIDMALRKVYVDEEPVEDSDIKEINDIRNQITQRMKVLTSYTDAFEIYEYILNRIEPKIKDTIDEEINVEELAEAMHSYVFSDDDKMLINSRIKDFVAQLPVRMAKNRFLDIINNSLSIYKGGEKSSAADFVQTVREVALISKPEGFDSLYPDFYNVYKELKDTDYKELDNDGYDRLTDLIDDTASDIQSVVTNYLMLTEIINDTLVVLYTSRLADSDVLDDYFKTSKEILGSLVKADDIYEAAGDFDEKFASLEGSQEQIYEELSFLSGNLDDIYSSYYDEYESLKDYYDPLFKADKLCSSSLYMDIDDDKSVQSGVDGITVVEEEADEAFIIEERLALANDFEVLFKDLGKYEKRSVMAKVLSYMPVFFNTKQEIHDYFSYALSSCSDKSELTACRNLIYDLMS